MHAGALAGMHHQRAESLQCVIATCQAFNNPAQQLPLTTLTLTPSLPCRRLYMSDSFTSELPVDFSEPGPAAVQHLEGIMPHGVIGELLRRFVRVHIARSGAGPSSTSSTSGQATGGAASAASAASSAAGQQARAADVAGKAREQQSDKLQKTRQAGVQQRDAASKAGGTAAPSSSSSAAAASSAADDVASPSDQQVSGPGLQRSSSAAAEAPQAAADADDAASSGKVCTNCGSSTAPKLKRCAQCRAVRYCSKECQKAHWASGHSKVCAPLG